MPLEFGAPIGGDGLKVSCRKADLPALIAKENAAPPDRPFKVRDTVTVDYGRGDRREAVILDFLGTYVYIKLATEKTDFVVASQVSIVKVNHNV